MPSPNLCLDLSTVRTLQAYTQRACHPERFRYGELMVRMLDGTKSPASAFGKVSEPPEPRAIMEAGSQSRLLNLIHYAGIIGGQALIDRKGYLRVPVAKPLCDLVDLDALGEPVAGGAVSQGMGRGGFPPLSAMARWTIRSAVEAENLNSFSLAPNSTAPSAATSSR